MSGLKFDLGGPGLRMGGYEGLQAFGFPGQNYDLGTSATLPGANVSLPDFTAVSPAKASFFDDPMGWFKQSGALDKIGPNGEKLNGWGGLALGAASAGLNAYLGMKQYGLAKDQFNFQKDSWQKEYDAQKGLTNASLEDRQRRRVAENPSLAQDTASYMAKYGVK